MLANGTQADRYNATQVLDRVREQAATRRQNRDNFQASTDELVKRMWLADAAGVSRNQIIAASGLARQTAVDMLHLHDLFVGICQLLEAADIPVNVVQGRHVMVQRVGTNLKMLVKWGDEADQDLNKARDTALAARAIAVLSDNGVAVQGDPTEAWALIRED